MKKFWLPVLQMIVASAICGTSTLAVMAIRDSREWRNEVNHRLTRIEQALHVPKETESKYAESNN